MQDKTSVLRSYVRRVVKEVHEGPSKNPYKVGDKVRSKNPRASVPLYPDKGDGYMSTVVAGELLPSQDATVIGTSRDGLSLLLKLEDGSEMWVISHNFVIPAAGPARKKDDRKDYTATFYNKTRATRTIDFVAKNDKEANAKANSMMKDGEVDVEVTRY